MFLNSLGFYAKRAQTLKLTALSYLLGVFCISISNPIDKFMRYKLLFRINLSIESLTDLVFVVIFAKLMNKLQLQ